MKFLGCDLKAGGHQVVLSVGSACEGLSQDLRDLSSALEDQKLAYEARRGRLEHRGMGGHHGAHPGHQLLP